MMNLILLEVSKYKRTYIYPVSLCAMILPVVFTYFAYSGDMFSNANWGTYLNSLNLFYGIFLGAIIPSFVAIFSVYQELKSGTIKSVLFSGYDRVKIIAAKMIYVCLYIVSLYAVVGVLTVVSGVMLGFDASASVLVHTFLSMLFAGAVSALFVPIMVYLTLLFKSFVPPLVIAFLGTIGSVVMINIGNAFYYPWLLPTNIFFRFKESGIANISLPTVVFAAYFLLFAGLAVIRFVRIDIDNKVS